MKTGVVIFLFLLITGCVSSRDFYVSEGQLAHSIDCSGVSFDWGLCYVEAGEICREKGYEVLEKKWTPKIGQCYKVESGLTKRIPEDG